MEKEICHKGCWDCDKITCCDDHCPCGGKLESKGDINKYDRLIQCSSCKNVTIT